jgi:hypothetical protein
MVPVEQVVGRPWSEPAALAFRDSLAPFWEVELTGGGICDSGDGGVKVLLDRVNGTNRVGGVIYSLPETGLPRSRVPLPFGFSFQTERDEVLSALSVPKPLINGMSLRVHGPHRVLIFSPPYFRGSNKRVIDVFDLCIDRYMNGSQDEALIVVTVQYVTKRDEVITVTDNKAGEHKVVAPGTIRRLELKWSRGNAGAEFLETS